MTHDELLNKLRDDNWDSYEPYISVLRAVVKLHEPFGPLCYACTCQEDEHIVTWPCQTIRAIKRELYHARVN